MAIKDEIQGQKGYMKKVRDNYLGATKEMANAAFEKYEKETGLQLTKENILKDIDGTLKNLLISETEIYNERSARIIAEVIPYYYQNIFEKEDANYPDTSSYIRHMLKIYQKCSRKTYKEEDFIREMFEITTPVIGQLKLEWEIRCRIIWKRYLKFVKYHMKHKNVKIRVGQLWILSFLICQQLKMPLIK